MGSDVVTKRAENFQTSWVLTKFGYARQCTECIEIIRSFRVLTNFGYLRECTKCIQNFQYSEVLRRFGYSHQCTKCIHYFLNCCVSECQYPNFGYCDTFQKLCILTKKHFFSLKVWLSWFLNKGYPMDRLKFKCEILPCYVATAELSLTLWILPYERNDNLRMVIVCKW